MASSLTGMHHVIFPVPDLTASTAWFEMALGASRLAKSLRTPALSPHFQCVLRRSGALDDMTVRVERRIDASSAQAAAAGRDLRGLIKSIVGVTVAVDIVDPDAVERSMGKMRRVIDERVAR